MTEIYFIPEQELELANTIMKIGAATIVGQFIYIWYLKKKIAYLNLKKVLEDKK